MPRSLAKTRILVWRYSCAVVSYVIKIDGGLNAQTEAFRDWSTPGRRFDNTLGTVNVRIGKNSRPRNNQVL